MTALPPSLIRARNLMITACNAINTLERLAFQKEWQAAASAARWERALDAVNKAVVRACDALGVTSAEKMQYQQRIRALEEQIATLEREHPR